MYFIVGKTINQGKQILSYLITDGEGIREVALPQVYVEYQKGNLPYLKGFDTDTGEVDFKNIDNILIPTFYNGRGISNSVSVLKILTDNDSQIGVRILVASGKIMNVRLSDIIKLANNKKIQLFNAKVVDNKIVMKYKNNEDKVNKIQNNKQNVNKEVTYVEPISLDFIRKCLTLEIYEDMDEEEILKAKNKLLQKYGNKRCILVPDDMTVIPDNWQKDNKDVEIVVLGNHTGVIGNSAFEGCTNLKYVLNAFINFDQGYATAGYIGKKAFANCKNLRHVGMRIYNDNKKIGLMCSPRVDEYDFLEGAGLIVIQSEAFLNCLSLKRIVICPALTVVLCDSAFENCKNLKFVELPNCVLPDVVDYVGKGSVDSKISVVKRDVSPLGLISSCENYCAIGWVKRPSYSSIEKCGIEQYYAFKLAKDLFKGCNSLEAIFIDRDTSFPMMVHSNFLDKVCKIENGKQLYFYLDIHDISEDDRDNEDNCGFYSRNALFFDLDSLAQFPFIKHILISTFDFSGVGYTDLFELYNNFVYNLPLHILWGKGIFRDFILVNRDDNEVYRNYDEGIDIYSYAPESIAQYEIKVQDMDGLFETEKAVIVVLDNHYEDLYKCIDINKLKLKDDMGYIKAIETVCYNYYKKMYYEACKKYREDHIFTADEIQELQEILHCDVIDKITVVNDVFDENKDAIVNVNIDMSENNNENVEEEVDVPDDFVDDGVKLRNLLYSK